MSVFDHPNPRYALHDLDASSVQPDDLITGYLLDTLDIRCPVPDDAACRTCDRPWIPKDVRVASVAQDVADERESLITITTPDGHELTGWPRDRVTVLRLFGA